MKIEDKYSQEVEMHLPVTIDAYHFRNLIHEYASKLIEAENHNTVFWDEEEQGIWYRYDGKNFKVHESVKNYSVAAALFKAVYEMEK